MGRNKTSEQNLFTSIADVSSESSGETTADSIVASDFMGSKNNLKGVPSNDMESIPTILLSRLQAAQNESVKAESSAEDLKEVLLTRKNQLQDSLDELDSLIEVMQGDTLYGESL